MNGLEIEMKGTWPDLQGRVGFAVQKSTDGTTGASLPSVPRTIGNLSLSSPVFIKKGMLGLEERYMGFRKTLAGNQVDSYLLTNLILNVPLEKKGWLFSFGIYNLFNRAYEDPAGEEHTQDVIGQDGRLFRIKIQKDF